MGHINIKMLSMFMGFWILMSCSLCSPQGNRVFITQHSQEEVAQKWKYKSSMPSSIALSYLKGKWFIPHNADINIVFNEDSTFIFHDYNACKDTMEVLKGTYSLKRNRLILKYSDRPQQVFLYHYGTYNDEYYIKKSNYYFVKQ